MTAVEVCARLLVGARHNEPIGERTTYRVGGPAALYFECLDEADLDLLSAAISTSGIEVLVLGAGSNLLIADSGFPGLCVVLGPSFGSISLDLEQATATAGAATSYPVLARQTVAARLGGMEWAVGIPGSVGGALKMNAGGHGSQTLDHLLSASIVQLSNGERRESGPGQLDLGYRSSNLAEDDLVLSASFQLSPDEDDEASQRLSEVVAWRREHQPGGRNAGSVFTNPPGDAAGRIIEQAGLKGHRHGSAVVSEKHANFFLLDKDGRADDLYGLIGEVTALVAERSGIELHTELRLIGFSR